MTLFVSYLMQPDGSDPKTTFGFGNAIIDMRPPRTKDEVYTLIEKVNSLKLSGESARVVINWIDLLGPPVLHTAATLDEPEGGEDAAEPDDHV